MIREYVLLYSPNKNADYPSIVSLANDRSRKDRLMKRRKLIALSAVFFTGLATFIISLPNLVVFAPKPNARAPKSGCEEAPPPIYNTHQPRVVHARVSS